MQHAACTGKETWALLAEGVESKLQGPLCSRQNRLPVSALPPLGCRDEAGSQGVAALMGGMTGASNGGSNRGQHRWSQPSAQDFSGPFHFSRLEYLQLDKKSGHSGSLAAGVAAAPRSLQPATPQHSIASQCSAAKPPPSPSADAQATLMAACACGTCGSARQAAARPPRACRCTRSWSRGSAPPAGG